MLVNVRVQNTTKCLKPFYISVFLLIDYRCTTLIFSLEKVLSNVSVYCGPFFGYTNSINSIFFKLKLNQII